MNAAIQLYSYATLCSKKLDGSCHYVQFMHV